MLAALVAAALAVGPVFRYGWAVREEADGRKVPLQQLSFGIRVEGPLP